MDVRATLSCSLRTKMQHRAADPAARYCELGDFTVALLDL